MIAFKKLMVLITGMVRLDLDGQKKLEFGKSRMDAVGCVFMFIELVLRLL